MCEAFLRGEQTGDLILFLRGHFTILVAHCFPRNAWHSGYSFIAYYNTVLENGSNFVPKTQSHRATWHNNDPVSHATSKRTSPDKMIESPSVASDNQTSWFCPLNVHIKEVGLYYWRGKPINNHCIQFWIVKTILLPASDISLGQANHGVSLQNSDIEGRIQ